MRQTKAPMLSDEDRELLYGETYTWADVCCVADCTHDNPGCGAWEEIRDLQGDGEDR